MCSECICRYCRKQDRCEICGKCFEESEPKNECPFGGFEEE